MAWFRKAAQQEQQSAPTQQDQEDVYARLDQLAANIERAANEIVVLAKVIKEEHGK